MENLEGKIKFADKAAGHLLGNRLAMRRNLRPALAREGEVGEADRLECGGGAGAPKAQILIVMRRKPNPSLFAL